jgi:hypothetical protein
MRIAPGYRWLIAVTLAASMEAAFAAGPVSPYKALGLPKAVHPTLSSAPVGTIRVGALEVRLEVTPLSAVQLMFGGVIRGAGDAANAVTWLCYAGKDAKQRSVVFWFASNDEMSGDHHEVTQIAVQDNPGGAAPAGCGVAPVGLRIEFGIPAVGSTMDEVSAKFGAGKPDARGFVSYASETKTTTPKEMTVMQSVQYRVRESVVTIVSVSQVSTQ